MNQLERGVTLVGAAFFHKAVLMIAENPETSIVSPEIGPLFCKNVKKFQISVYNSLRRRVDWLLTDLKSTDSVGISLCSVGKSL
ncbi:hypothetical protein V6x_63470 [Gimesia chilikensis]|uniref:Uncharacterized protein n=1 Tax=Gimesia chilikensis TaxID=2605989 RepID=A0A517WMX9_9PLAN|nr:hypothetical protein [Gimesia chilikensis]QDU06593.1 hypothetical protein V6x_63470 [Gimesia chilikensis]